MPLVLQDAVCRSASLRLIVAPTLLLQVFYTLDVSQYAIGADENENFYHCINKALQTREPLLMRQLAGHVARVLRCAPSPVSQ